MSTTDDLAGVTMVHLPTASTARITERKPDDTGWYIEGGGGLADYVIESGDWVPLGIVVAFYKAGHNARSEGSDG